MSEKKRYDCKENDNHIYYFPPEIGAEDEGGEFRIGDCLERSWIVVGEKDLLEVVKMAKVTYNDNTSL